MFYVYLHRRLDTNEVFYIGKGTKKRAWDRDSRKTQKWKDIVNSVGYSVEIYRDNLTEQEADLLETELINTSQWNLVNVTLQSTRVKEISFDTVNRLFEYDSSSPSGLVRKTEGYRRYKVGDVAGSRKHRDNGDPAKWSVYVGNRLVAAHRIVYVLFNPDFDQSLYINHIDCNPHNNLIENLEAVTKQQNNTRTKLHTTGITRRNNKTGITGVSYQASGYYVGFYTDKSGLFHRQHFSISKLGKVAALEMAKQWRLEKHNSSNNKG